MTQQIGQFRILGELGAGGMGIVYRALDTAVQREVALKRLRSEFAASSAVLERFRNEAKMQGRLNHPNIAQLYSIVQTQEAFCIVMELVDGIVAKDLIPFRWELAALVIGQALDAIGYAHSLGVLHRDIKPENIIIDRRGMVKVMDFGIAYAVGSQRMTREKSIVGTIEYMSPERILGKPMDGRSDIYAIGILLYELLSGRLPFDLTNEYEVLSWHLEETPPHVTSAADVPAFFDAIVDKAIRKDPEERYASCAEMAEHLQAAIPSGFNATDALRGLVADRARTSRPAAFDESSCLSLAARHLADGDLDGAERLLRSELNRHPQMESLRSYHALVMRAQSETALVQDAVDGPAKLAELLCWLRLIAAERASDRNAYATELRRIAEKLPNTPALELLQLREQRGQDHA
jgi:serine/threonine protein kinase